MFAHIAGYRIDIYATEAGMRTNGAVVESIPCDVKTGGLKSIASALMARSYLPTNGADFVPLAVPNTYMLEVTKYAANNSRQINISGDNYGSISF